MGTDCCQHHLDSIDVEDLDSSSALSISSYRTNVSAIVEMTSLYFSTNSRVDSFNLQHEIYITILARYDRI